MFLPSQVNRLSHQGRRRPGSRYGVVTCVAVAAPRRRSDPRTNDDTAISARRHRKRHPRHDRRPRDGGAVSGVVRAVAAVDGVDPVDLDATIEEAIDADALESLARHDATDWRLEFPLGDHAIVVEGDGTVLVDASVFPNRF
ncbi:HalOD1 output domain-containing protein [Halobaculum halobium]|uniref:HalOD1 output domain-containing protein n=1 Tax=Halobaculum halobium TaxID=3032281 RepID=UPI003609B7EB